MVERRRTLGITARRPSAPALQSQGGALAQEFFSISGFFSAQKEKEDALLATEQGAAAALATSITVEGQQIPTFVKAEGTTAFASTFNKRGLAIYGARMEMALREKARALSIKHRLNPAGMKTEMDAFITGLKASAPPELQAFFEAQGQQLIGPRIDASVERLVSLKQKDTAATLAALMESTVRDAQDFAAQVTLGGAGSPAALQQIAVGTKTYLDKVINSIDGVTYTVGMARRDWVNYQSEVGKRVLMGMFDGADDKNALYARFLRGELDGKIKIDMPVLTAEGKIMVKKGANVIDMMSPTALDAVRVYMGTRVDALHSARERGRAEAERVGNETVDAQIKRAFLGDNTALTDLTDNPYADANQLKEAFAYSRDAPARSDGTYIQTVDSLIIAGQITHPVQLDASRLSLPDREKRIALIDQYQNANHFTRSAHFKFAEDNIRRAITDTASDLLGANVVTSKGASAMKNQAAAQMLMATRRKTQEWLDQGAVIGDNKGDAVTAEITKGDGTKVIQFDPDNWAKAKLKIVNELVKSTTTRLKAKLDELRATAAAARTAANEGEFNKLFARQMKLARELRDLKATLRSGIILETLGDEGR